MDYKTGNTVLEFKNQRDFHQMKIVTSSHVLEASGSTVVMLLLVMALFALSTKAEDKVLSILSVSLSKRIAAITESNFRDWRKRVTE